MAFPLAAGQFFGEGGTVRGDGVKSIQTELKRLGLLSGLADGIYGALTTAAVIAYQKSKSVAADGLVGSKTWGLLFPAAPDVPAPIVTPGAVDDFRFGQWNTQLQRFGGIDDDSPLRGRFMRDTMKCSFYALSECSVAQQAAILKVLDGYRETSYKTIANVWNPAAWQAAATTDADKVDFGETPFHGALRTRFTSRENGAKLDLIGIHVRPSDAFPDSWSDERKQQAKQGDIREALTKLYVKGRKVIFAGDFSTGSSGEVMLPAGFKRATPKADTYDKPGDQAVDAVFVTPNLVVRDHALLNPGPVSDHKAWLYNGSIK